MRLPMKLAFVVAAVLVPMSLPIGSWDEARAVSGGPTGWCTDHSGRNYRCASGSGSSGGGGGGCAQAIREQRYADAEARRTGNFMNREGNKLYKQRRFAEAAGAYHTAFIQDPSNHVAKRNYGGALNEMGVVAWNRGDRESALLYYERAVEYKRTEIIDGNLRDALNKAPNARNKTCRLCSTALISDIGYGLDSSAEFSNYASQAIQNFGNCSRRLSRQCKGSAGHDLREQIIYCSRNFISRGMNAYKGCVRPAHAAARRKL